MADHVQGTGCTDQQHTQIVIPGTSAQRHRLPIPVGDAPAHELSDGRVWDRPPIRASEHLDESGLAGADTGSAQSDQITCGSCVYMYASA